MKVAVIGGGLQGLEAVYLAAKAGWRTLLIDKRPWPPARSLADEFICWEAAPRRELPAELKTVDVVLPALEDEDTLTFLHQECRNREVPFALKLDAWRFTSSKRRSSRLFRELGLPLPEAWPRARLPVFVKPDDMSGSRGVERVDDHSRLAELLAGAAGSGLIIQELVSGPSYSVEVVGHQGLYLTGQITELFMDSTFDCKRVCAPVDLPRSLARSLEDMAVKTARAIELTGIMDMEVILHQGQLKILEIDARLPSQTPATVYWSTGVNLVDRLLSSTLGGDWRFEFHTPRPVAYEHLACRDGWLCEVGEGRLLSAGELKVERDFFGAAEAVTDFRDRAGGWVATLIHTGRTKAEVEANRLLTRERMVADLGLEGVIISEAEV